MANPGGGAQDDRGPVTLADLHGHGHEIDGLLAVGGLEDRHLGQPGVPAGVLLVLGGMAARIVGHADDQPPLDPDGAEVQQGVGGHVQPHVLHGHQTTRASQTRPHRHFQGHLLVRRPLAVDLVAVEHEVLEDLGGGRARIPSRHRHASLIGPARDGFVAGEKFSQVTSPE